MGCRVSCYSELEEISLHDGVFFERAHAEAYVGMFTPRLELIDKDKLNSDPRSETFLSAAPLFSRTPLENSPSSGEQGRQALTDAALQSSEASAPRLGSGGDWSEGARRRISAAAAKEIRPRLQPRCRCDSVRDVG